MKKRRKHILLGIVSIFIATLVVGYFEGERIDVTTYTFQTSKKMSQEVIIGQLTDLHALTDLKREDEIISKLKQEKVTHIVLTGDIVTDKAKFEETYQFIERLKQIAPIYYVSGNHDYDNFSYDEISERLTNLGVEVMNNRYIDINESVRFIGVEDVGRVSSHQQSDEDRIRMETRILDVAKKSVDESKYNVLLYHRPHYMDAFSKGGYDLVLTGHVHGGQWQDPFHLVSAIGPDQGLFPKYFRGMHTEGKTKMINSRGLAFNTKVPRFFNSREIVIVKLK